VTLYYTTVTIVVTLSVNVLTHMLTNMCMMYSISHKCTGPLLDPLEYNNKSN